jgi:hypothetical protein
LLCCCFYKNKAISKKGKKGAGALQRTEESKLFFVALSFPFPSGKVSKKRTESKKGVCFAKGK